MSSTSPYSQDGEARWVVGASPLPHPEGPSPDREASSFEKAIGGFFERVIGRHERYRPEKPQILRNVESRIDSFFSGAAAEIGGLYHEMDLFEEKVRFKEGEPAVYGGLGHFYAKSWQELKAGREMILKVVVPGFAGHRSSPELWERVTAHFSGGLFLQSAEDPGPRYELEVVRLADSREYDAFIEHPDRSHLKRIAFNGQKAAIVKVAVRLKTADEFPSVGERGFFHLVQPGREGETLLVYDESDRDFGVLHLADPHVRANDYRLRLAYLRNQLEKVDRLYEARAITGDQAAREKLALLWETKEIAVNYDRHLQQMVGEAVRRYRSGEIDFVVIHGDEIDNVNDSDSLQQRPFSGEHTRLLAFRLYQAGVPFWVETGNHPGHRPNYLARIHPPAVNTDPRLSPKGQEQQKEGYAANADPGRGYGTLWLGAQITRALTTKAAGEAMVVDPETFRWTDFFTNSWLVLKEIFTYDLFDVPPERQTADDDFRGNQYLYVNSEPNVVLRYKGHTFMMTDDGREDFKYFRYMVQNTPEALRPFVYVFLFVPILPFSIDGIHKYLHKQEVPAKGYTDPALRFFIHTLADELRRQGCTVGEAVTCNGLFPEVTFSAHFPLFHYLDVLFGDDYTANTLNTQSRRAVLIFLWYFRDVIKNLIFGHIHRWEAYSFDFDLSPEKKEALRGELYELGMRSRIEWDGGVTDTDIERFQKELNKLWDKYDLDEHLRLPPSVAQSHGDDEEKILEECRQRGEPCQLTLRASGPAYDQNPAGFAIQHLKGGKTERFDLFDIFYNSTLPATVLPHSEGEAEVGRRVRQRRSSLDPLPSRLPLAAEDPYEGISF
ncbi:MAG: hypothetical protein HYS22_02810 [Deltaproteobacteria bacterium]|nr:hypothetical protein [Deltaproteobacteria bacterium]